MLPWASAEEEQTRALMGDDYWPYGFAANADVLETFTRYSFEQGLSKRKLDPARTLRARNAGGVQDLRIRRFVREGVPR